MIVEEALGVVWRDVIAPQVPRVDACILAGRVASETLRYFGVDHEVCPVEVLAANDVAVEEMAAGRGVPEWPADAWSVGCSSTAGGDGDGWAGHLVVATKDRFVDLTAAQMDRSVYRIVTGGPLVVPWDRFEIFAHAPFFVGMGVSIEAGVYAWAGDPENRSYRAAPDWRSNWRSLVGPAIREVRARL